MSFGGLLSVPRAFLAVSAALAGYCLFRFYADSAGNQLVLPYLLLAAAFLALADSAWQGIFAAAAKAAAETGEYQYQGSLSPAAAFCVAVFSSLTGLMCAMTGGFNSFRAGGLLLIAILARHCLFRGLEIVSPLLGGLSAGLFLILGMTAHPAFIEMIHVQEIRVPAAFFAIYMTVGQVIAMAGGGRKAGAVPGRPGEAAGDGVSRATVGLGGGVLILMQPLLAWLMPWSWLSWTFLLFLALSLAMGLVPVLAYRAGRELDAYADAIRRGGVFLTAGAVASLGNYVPREIHEGWAIPLPGREELAAALVIILLAAPAWLARRRAGAG